MKNWRSIFHSKDAESIFDLNMNPYEHDFLSYTVVEWVHYANFRIL